MNNSNTKINNTKYEVKKLKFESITKSRFFATKALKHNPEIFRDTKGIWMVYTIL